MDVTPWKFRYSFEKKAGWNEEAANYCIEFDTEAKLDFRRLVQSIYDHGIVTLDGRAMLPAGTPGPSGSPDIRRRKWSAAASLFPERDEKNQPRSLRQKLDEAAHRRIRE